MQGTQYATKRSILCKGAFCGPTVPSLVWGNRLIVDTRAVSLTPIKMYKKMSKLYWRMQFNEKKIYVNRFAPRRGIEPRSPA